MISTADTHESSAGLYNDNTRTGPNIPAQLAAFSPRITRPPLRVSYFRLRQYPEALV